MTHVLNIQSSPRGSHSASIAVTDAFLAAYRDAQTGALTIDTLNVWEEDLPEFDQEAIDAKYKGAAQQPMEGAEAALWQRIEALAARFKAADLIVLGVPMWNFAYPYKLKQLIDLACQRGLLFSFDGTSFGPLLRGPQAMVVYTQGQSYAGASPTPADTFDYQTGYIDFWLHFIGAGVVRSLTVPDTWGDKAAAGIARGQQEARALAADF